MQKDFKNYWGIDVSKNWLDIAIDQKVYRIDQTETKINEFIKKQTTLSTLAVLESTGGYEYMAARLLSESGIRIHIAHPTKVKAFARAKGRLAKTDKIDAKLLQDYGHFIEADEIRDLPSKKAQELRSWGARLEQLKEMHHQESCRLGIASNEFVKKSIKMLLKAFAKSMIQAEKAIMGYIESDGILKEKYTLLRSMKGVGPVLAMTLIASLPELGEANKKEIAALVGVAPITNESGQKRGKAMTKYGRHGVRKILYMGALSACRYNAKFKCFYEKLIAAGKPKKVAIVAVMRKMIVVLNAMIASKSHFLA